MSIELITKAFKTKTANSTQKLILIKLADNANDDGQCFPSHRHIADQCQCTRRTVINAIKALEEQGLLTIEERRDFNSGQQKSNIYHLHLDGAGNLEEMESDSGSNPEDSPPENPENGGEGGSPGGETGSHLGVNNIHGGSEKYSQGEGEEYSHITVTSSNRQDNRQLNRQEKASKPAKKSGYSEQFEKWWSIYPRKTAKGAAWNRWKRDKLDSKVNELVEKLEQQNALQYAFTETQYIPNASTYLNQKRYDDEVEFKGKKPAQATTLQQHNQSVVDQYFSKWEG